MMPVDMLAQNIISLNLPWIEPANVICTNMTADQKNDVDNTILFLTEATNQPANYSNDTIKRWQLVVELQIFWGLDPDVDNIQIAEIELMKKIINQGWLVEQSSPHTTDPDTKQITKTIYFIRNEEIK